MRFVALLIVGIVLMWLVVPSGAQDDDADPTVAMATINAVMASNVQEALIADLMRLSTRVAVLETQVAELRAQPSSRAEPTPENETHTLTGSVRLTHEDALTWSTGDLCVGTGGYDDLRSGADVVVMDGQGGVLAVGRLKAGKAETETVCKFDFEVKGVPRADFYRFEISHREAPSYSYDDMVRMGWRLELSIG